MNIQIDEGRRLIASFAPGPEVADAGAAHRMEVNVIFTNEEGTLAALKTAHDLAFDLGARINLIAMQEVPWVLPLTCPPVPIHCTEQRLFNLVCQGVEGPTETNVQVCLCRDKREALVKALRPKSLVVIGGKMLSWFSETTRIAKMLERHGHRVVFAMQR
jgi:hypothetical protein